MEANDLCFAGTVFLPSTQCKICSDAEQGKMTRYAKPRAHTKAHFNAVKISERTIDRRSRTYLKDYLEIYRSEYQPVYDTYFEIYRKDYYNKLLEKCDKNHESVCIYHLESIIRRHF